MKSKNLTKRLTIWAVVVTVILMIPFVTKAPWTLFDYTFAGIVLFGLSSIYELSTKNIQKTNQKLIIAVIILTILICIWAWAVN